ncbi:hypothetical protein QYF61_012378 [Mycteria americana]|uniref:LIM zinc-binding domain-containing protein n=1 Tax=Mycteria americana TaxID=33587 RepID=A0AAN7MPC7_MYCAM|nr:hypothetical protein QYF61_012378 [Mycteria americana]
MVAELLLDSKRETIQGRIIPSTDEDRRRIIKQMKVRTTLKGDKSWIQHHNSDSEDEKKSSPLSGRASGGSPASTAIAPQSDRSSASKPQSGYLIRGVFTRTIDKTSSVPDSSSSNEAQKRAPYNVKQKSVDLDEDDVPFTPDEHKKRTEAANSVLRRTASRERAYVLSAAKKSNGSPTQEFPPLFAKRIEIEEEEGQQRRSPAVSGSCRLTPDDNSPETGSKSQPTTSLSETSERISTSAEISYPEHTEANNGFYPPNSNSGCRDRPADATDKLHRQYETSHHLDDAKSEPARSVLGYEERSSTQESRYTSPEVPAYSKPYWNEATSSQEGSIPRERGHESTRVSDDHKPELIQEGSSSLPTESSITAPETQCANESDPCRERITPAYEEQTCPTTGSHHESPGDWRHNEPSPVAARSNFSSKESALSAYETQHPMPLYMDRQPFNTSVSAPSHRIPSYVDSQVFSTRRPTPDYEGRVYDGRSSPRNSRYDSASARGHCEFNPTTGRLLSSSNERICSPIATLPHNSPVASGYQPDSSTAGKGVLFVKEYVNSSELSASPRYGSGSLADLTDSERATYSHHSYLSSPPLQRSSEPVCSYCSREIRDCPKIIVEHLNICCHEYCFRCGICHKAMGDLLDKIFIHRDIVHCDKCYEKLF